MKALITTVMSGALILASCTSSPNTVATPAAPAQVKQALAAISADVSEASLRGYIDKMVSFGTRHTLSDQVSETRGIGAARRWVEGEFRKMSADCGGCLEVVTVQDTVTSLPRVPNPTLVANAVAIQRGTSDPNRVIIIQGHLDSRVTDVMNFTADAPGANDDASGVAAVMESARVLSKRKFDATLVFAALSGEEQGLLGGRILANYAKAQGWEVSPSSTTISSATATVWQRTSTTACACSPRACVRWKPTQSPLRAARLAAKWTRLRATSRAIWT